MPPPLHPQEFDSTYYQKLHGPESLLPITNCFNNFQEWVRFNEPPPTETAITQRTKHELQALNQRIYHNMNQLLGTLGGQSQHSSAEELNKELKSNVAEFVEMTKGLKARQVRDRVADIMKQETAELKRRTAEMQAETAAAKELLERAVMEE